MDATTRQSLIERYREGPAVVRDAIRKLPDGALDRSVDGWTPRQVVHHLADSEMTSAIRLRRLLAEDSTLIVGYDEEEFARRLYYDRPIEASLAAMAAARHATAEILDRLGEDEWRRAGTHSESGPYSVETWLEIYAAHAHDHARQILQAAGIPD